MGSGLVVEGGVVQYKLESLRDRLRAKNAKKCADLDEEKDGAKMLDSNQQICRGYSINSIL